MQPIMDKDMEEVEAAEERKYLRRAGRRKNMGLHPPKRPTKEAQWRLDKVCTENPTHLEARAEHKAAGNTCLPA